MPYLFTEMLNKMQCKKKKTSLVSRSEIHTTEYSSFLDLYSSLYGILRS